MKKIAAFLGVGIAVVFLWFLIKNINYQELKSEFQNLNFSLILLALFVFFIGYALRIERWRVMLIKENPDLRWRHCAGPVIASIAANNVLPFRAGDLLRAFGFNKRIGITASTSLASMYVERLLDLLMVISFMAGGLEYFGLNASAFVGYGAGALACVSALIVVLLLYPSLFRPLAGWFEKYLMKINVSLAESISKQLAKIFSALDHMSGRHIVTKLIFLSFLAWVSEALVFFLVAMSVPTLTNISASLLAFSVGTLATVIPSTPGYVGTFDYFVAETMLKLGNTQVSSATFAFVVHIVIWLPISIVGGLYLLINPLRTKLL